jgi:protoheme IX farnesyltransferase
VLKTLKAYYYLAKPGIIRGNLLTATAGFVVATGIHLDWWLLLATLSSIALIIGSACVINNYIDRDIDQKMHRTKKRATATGLITPRNTLVYAALLGISGFTILSIWTNWLTVLIGAIGYIDYVAIYTFSKRRTWHATLIGSICGSAPVVAGYTAVTGKFDTAALILLLILTFWQMPHFYAIAMRRLDDYKAANIPVLPAVRGTGAAKVQMVAYMLAFLVSVLALSLFGYAGLLYAVVMGALVVGWLVIALKGWQTTDTKSWATKVFLYSLILLPAFLCAILIDALVAA